MGFPEAVSSSSLVGIDSVTNLSTPFTNLTQDAVWSSNKDGTRTSILYRSSRLQTFMLKTAQISCSCKSILSYVSFFRPDPLCILSAQMLHLSFPFFWVKSTVLLRPASNQLQNMVSIISGLRTIVRILSRILAPGFPSLCIGMSFCNRTTTTNLRRIQKNQVL